MVVLAGCAFILGLCGHGAAPGEGFFSCSDALSWKSQLQPLSNTSNNTNKAESVWLLSSAVRVFWRKPCHRLSGIVCCFNSVDHDYLQPDIQVHRDAWNELGEKVLSNQVQLHTRCGYLIKPTRNHGLGQMRLLISYITYILADRLPGVVGMAAPRPPRTDPYVQNYHIRLLP